ncbi:MAG: hypothetical protein QM626_13770 [Microbacterium sp.]|uniref:hypothetical protein n=1 Tax=Microbacterium sp. TaxID=51671 RepID=UPI0039E3F092
MDLARKLQLPPGGVLLRTAAADLPDAFTELASTTDAAAATAAVVLVRVRAELASAEVRETLEFARRDAVSWIAYPKAGQLGTDLNRDSLADLVRAEGLRPVRQVSIDPVWSALRFRPAEG